MPGELACPRCQTLLQAKELARLRAIAEGLERSGQLMAAREQWQMTLPLLPAQSKQAEWVRDHSRALGEAASKPADKSSGRLARRLAPLGPLAVLLAKAKAVLLVLFKLKFLLSFASFIAVYWALFGWAFGVGFAVMILLHEFGHYVDIVRRGLPAEMPVFIPGMGAYVQWNAMGVPLSTRAEISLAGPLAGWLCAAACALMWLHSGNPLWAALARAGAWLNIFNLIPVWQLDGGQAAAALGRTARILLCIAAIGGGLLLRENLLFIFALGAGYRVFTRDLPERPSTSSAVYFFVVMGLLAGLLYLMPASGSGMF